MASRNGVAHAAEKQYNKFIDIIESAKIQKNAKKAVSSATDLMKDHPVASIAIALGAGFILMKLIRR